MATLSIAVKNEEKNKQGRLYLDLQLRCSSVRHWDYVITFTIEVRFKIWDQFWVPQGKLHGAYVTWIFCKTSKCASLTMRHVLVFSRRFRHIIGPLRTKSFFYWVGTSSCLQMSDNFSRTNVLYYIAITCTREHLIIEITHISLTPHKNLKIISRTNQGTSEGIEILTQEYLARRIQICRVYFCFDISRKGILKKEVNMNHTKIDTQLDCRSARLRRKNTSQKYRKGYDNSETAIGKLSASRIQIFLVYFCITYVWPLFSK